MISLALMRLESDVLEIEINSIEKLLNKFQGGQNHSRNATTIQNNLENTINTYLSSKRITSFYLNKSPSIINLTRYEHFETIITDLEEFPEKDQLSGAFDGLFLLHETYNLNLSDLSKGYINVPGPLYDDGSKNKIQSPYECSAMDFEFLAKHAFNLEHYDRAYEFIKAAKNKAKEKEEYENQFRKIIKTLSIVKREHDATLMKKGSRGRDWRTFRLPFNRTLASNKKFKKVRNRKHEWQPVILNQIKPQLLENLSNKEQKTMLKEQFNMLCRGENLRTFQNAGPNLQSFYLHHKNSYLKLGPFKLEPKNQSPFLGIFGQKIGTPGMKLHFFYIPGGHIF